MSPIYLPSLFCGINAKLRLKKDLKEDNLYIGEIGTVTEIKAYTYFIKFEGYNETIRMKNGIMEENFEILDMGEKCIDVFAIELLKLKQPINVILKREIIIKDVITFEIGKEFFAVDNNENDRRFWYLFDKLTNERIISLRDDEFNSYF